MPPAEPHDYLPPACSAAPGLLHRYNHESERRGWPARQFLRTFPTPSSRSLAVLPAVFAALLALQWDNVTIACFLMSYVVALGFEAAQLLRQHAVSHWLALAMATAGIVAQSIYLVVRSRTAGMPPLLSSTHDWLLVLALLIVALYVFVELVDRRVALGLFVIPIVLVLVGLSRYVSDAPNPSLVRAPWRGLGMFHASMLVLGMVCVLASFLMSVMYLLQHRRLKTKRGETAGLHLLSLATLSRINWWGIVLAVPLLTLGMATGVWLSYLSASTDAPVSLQRWQFLVSGIVWLAMAALFLWLLTGRSHSGRMVAWRTLWACGFLFVTLLLLQLAAGGVHGTSSEFSRTPNAPGTVLQRTTNRAMDHEQWTMDERHEPAGRLL